MLLHVAAHHGLGWVGVGGGGWGWVGVGGVGGGGGGGWGWGGGGGGGGGGGWEVGGGAFVVTLGAIGAKERGVHGR